MSSIGIPVSAGHVHPSQTTPLPPPKDTLNRPRIKVCLPPMPPSPYSAEKLKNQSKTDISESNVVETPPPNTTTKIPSPARKLVPMIPIPIEALKEDFDHSAWHRKLYGPDIIVVDVIEVPKGWVLVDGLSHWYRFRIIVLDYRPQPAKMKKRWNRCDRTDPNWRGNVKRANSGLRPIDKWNIGVEYEWDGKFYFMLRLTSLDGDLW